MPLKDRGTFLDTGWPFNGSRLYMNLNAKDIYHNLHTKLSLSPVCASVLL